MVDPIKSLESLNSYAPLDTENRDQFAQSLDRARQNIEYASAVPELDSIERDNLAGQTAYNLAAGNFEGDFSGFAEEVSKITGQAFASNGDYSQVDRDVVVDAFIRYLRNGGGSDAFDPVDPIS